MMRCLLGVLRAATLLVLAIAIGCSKVGGSGVLYHCPMHPTYVSNRPGDCPICGMRLVPIEPAKKEENAPPSTGLAVDAGPGAPPGSSTEVPGYAPIDIAPEGLKLAGVRTAVAERGSLSRTIRAAGVVRADERRIRHVHTKISGWIEKLFIDFTGQAVQKGNPILSIYSPELLASQEDYLRAREAIRGLAQSQLEPVRKSADAMLSAARRRLELFDVPESLLSELDRTGQPQRSVTLLAPVSGIVTGKQIFEGQQVEPGMELFDVSDLSQVWIEADVYESEMPAIRVGQPASVLLPSGAGAPLVGRVKYIYPYLNPDTRTLKVRLDFPNPGAALKLDMFVNVELSIESGEGVLVPDSAVMDTGLRQIAFVTPAPGRFEPRVVKVGIRSDGKAQIVSGVAAGERVAVKANFLLDSESRLRAAITNTGAPEPHPAGERP